MWIRYRVRVRWCRDCKPSPLRCVDSAPRLPRAHFAISQERRNFPLQHLDIEDASTMFEAPAQSLAFTVLTAYSHSIALRSVALLDLRRLNYTPSAWANLQLPSVTRLHLRASGVATGVSFLSLCGTARRLTSILLDRTAWGSFAAYSRHSPTSPLSVSTTSYRQHGLLNSIFLNPRLLTSSNNLTRRRASGRFR